ncbi:MAG: hypothetical protein ABW208_10660 [Pyrinomonadaceae bacterium]
MPYRMFKVVASFCLTLVAAAAAVAQTPPVKIKFEVDGKEYRKPIRIFIAAHYDEFKPPIIEPRVKDEGFIFPPGLDGLKFDEVSVRVVCGIYTLEFTEVEVGKFTGQLIFGVDHKPFDPEFLKFKTPEEQKRLAVLHYIKFIPEDGDPTWMTVGTNR